jgi:hypothetical protein
MHHAQYNVHTAQDPACNNKLLALCGAGMLSSIATLIHDTYLPVYLQDVLGLSNTRVSSNPLRAGTDTALASAAVVASMDVVHRQAPQRQTWSRWSEHCLGRSQPPDSDG